VEPVACWERFSEITKGSTALSGQWSQRGCEIAKGSTRESGANEGWDYEANKVKRFLCVSRSDLSVERGGKKKNTPDWSGVFFVGQ